MSQSFPSALSRAVFYNKYSRWRDALGRREMRHETIERAWNFLEGRFHEKGGQWQQGEMIATRSLMETFDVLPSMRVLWSAGPALSRNHVMGYNCSFMTISRLAAFREALFILMAGTGVGYSVEEEYVAQLPRIKKQKRAPAAVHTVIDSTEGWCDALDAGIETWWNGGDIEFDYSQVRPAGARLMTKGGRSSGPEPLKSALQQIRRLILSREKRNPTPLLVHDIMCIIAQVVVVGGIRRASLICLSDLDDLAMRAAKHGEFWRSAPWRAMANNSVAYNEQPSTEEFLDEWMSLMRGKSGERGIFNREAWRSTSPRRKRWNDTGTNPCVPSTTWVNTTEGARQVKDLIGRPFVAVVDGKPQESPTGFLPTGVQRVYEVQTNEGYSFSATANHLVMRETKRTDKKQCKAWTAVGDLKIGDKLVLHDHRSAEKVNDNLDFKLGWLLGSLKGDGCFYRQSLRPNAYAKLSYWGRSKEQMVALASAYLNETVRGRSDRRGSIAKNRDRADIGSVGLATIARTYGMEPVAKCVTPAIEKSSPSFTAGFLRGWFDADGSVQGSLVKGVSVRLASIDKPGLEAAQRMLLRLGIPSVIYARQIEGLRQLPDGKGSSRDYFCQQSWELVVANEAVETYESIVGFAEPVKTERLHNIKEARLRKPNRSKFTATVSAIIPGERVPVYDCAVPSVEAFDANGFYVHNCGEINLRDMQFCNLSEIVCRPDDTRQRLVDKIRAATILGTVQATLTDFPYLNLAWSENCVNEALLGVSATGQMDCPAFRDADIQRELKRVAIEVNQDFAQRLGIAQAAAVTCTKPSGTASLLVNSSSGQHTRWSKFYIRRIRLNTGDPMLTLFHNLGMAINADPVTPATWVVDFPMKSPEGSLTRHDLTAAQQLEHWRSLKVNFTEHNPSATIYVRDDEWLFVGNWVYEHWNLIGGLSFLPTDDHVYPLAPHEEITEERYNELMARFPQMTDEAFADALSQLETDDMTTGAQEYACTGGVCEIAV